MKVYLKIKLKSLAAEATIIRKEERRFPGDSSIRAGLHTHRVHAVRKEARAAGLAYGFLRGRDYRRLEQRCHTAPDWEQIERLVIKYGEGDRRDIKQRFAAWRDGAEVSQAA